MKKPLSLAILALAIGAANAADIKPGFYVKMGLGKSLMGEFKGNNKPVDYVKSTPTNNVTYIGAIGYNFGKGFRLDLNGQMKTLNYDSTDAPRGAGRGTQQIDNYSIFLNAYYGISTRTILTPYVTAGLGYSHNKAGDLVLESTVVDGLSTSNFAWNLGVGTTINVNTSTDLDIAYRYLNLGKAGGGNILSYGLTQTGTCSAQNIKAHQITFGLIYKL